MFEILIISLLLVLNGLFAMSEIALVSSRRSRLQQRAMEGSRGANVALKLLDEPEKFLSTVQIGITLVGIIAGAYGAEKFTQDVQPIFERITFLKPYADEISFALVVAVITYFTLIIGELVPKSIAMNNPERITIVLAQFMRFLAIVTYPFVAFLSASTKLFLKLIRVRESKEPPVTEEELKYLIDVGSQHGIIEKQESEIMHEVFRFADRTANLIMTNRKDVFWIDINKSKEEILDLIRKTPYTKFPVCNGKIDEIIGVVWVKDVFFLTEGKKEFDLKSVIRDPVFIPDKLPALKVLDLFRRKRLYIGFVVNEYGGIEGLITLTDLVENIIGDLAEFEIEKAQIVSRDDGSWLADSEVRIEDFKNVLNIKRLPGEGTYTTLGGFVINQLRRIPKAGESFEYLQYKFEIVDMDGHRIDKVLITKIKE